MKRLVLLIVALCSGLVCIKASAAVDCDNDILPQALANMLQQPQNSEAFLAQIKTMDSYLELCPEHAWVNAMGSMNDFNAFQLITKNNNGVPNQQAVSFITRALLRSDKFFAAPHEQRKDIIKLQTARGEGSLRSQAAYDTRSNIIKGLIAIARQGAVHPYLKAEQPLDCESATLGGDAQTIGFAIQEESDLAFLPFVDGAAAACDQVTGKIRLTPYATKARVYLNAVKKQLIREPEQVRDALEKAKAAELAYIQGYSHTIHFDKNDSHQLDVLMREHEVGPWLAKELWFTEEHVNSEAAIEAIALYLNDNYSSLVAGTLKNVDSSVISQAQAEFAKKIYALFNQGQTAGYERETRSMLYHSLKAFETGEIRTLPNKELPPPPDYLLRVLYSTFKPQVESNSSGD